MLYNEKLAKKIADEMGVAWVDGAKEITVAGEPVDNTPMSKLLSEATLPPCCVSEEGADEHELRYLNLQEMENLIKNIDELSFSTHIKITFEYAKMVQNEYDLDDTYHAEASGRAA